MKDSKEIEQILLKDENYEKFISKKIEKDFTSLVSEKKSEPKSEITDFSKVPREKLFSKNVTYIIINKQSKTQSYINGIQAEGFLGAQDSVRKKLFSGIIDAFVSGENYIKFYKYVS